MKNYLYPASFESERLTTRLLTLDDVPAWAEFFEDSEATAFFQTFLPKTSATEQARFWIEKQLARYAERRFGLHALIDKKTGAFVGQCGLLAQDVNGQPETEVGYSILPRYWGQGYAAEAAKLFFDHAFTVLQEPYVVSIIDKANLKSQRVAEKNGLYRWREAEWGGMDVWLYRIDANK